MPSAGARLAASRDSYQRGAYVYHRCLTKRLQTDEAHAFREASHVCLLSIVLGQPGMLADMQIRRRDTQHVSPTYFVCRKSRLGLTLARAGG